jgi:hypothetical protein
MPSGRAGSMHSPRRGLLGACRGDRQGAAGLPAAAAGALICTGAHATSPWQLPLAGGALAILACCYTPGGRADWAAHGRRQARRGEARLSPPTGASPHVRRAAPCPVRSPHGLRRSVQSECQAVPARGRWALSCVCGRTGAADASAAPASAACTFRRRRESACSPAAQQARSAAAERTRRSAGQLASPPGLPVSTERRTRSGERARAAASERRERQRAGESCSASARRSGRGCGAAPCGSEVARPAAAAAGST